MPVSVTVAPAQTRQLPMLTGIRALAAMLVLGFHINFYFPEIHLKAHIAFLERGNLGVDLFFILSGFIITHVYFFKLARPTRAAAAVYIWHRFIRIYPVHVVVLLALAVTVKLLSLRGITPGHPEAWQVSDFFRNLALLQVWSYNWSRGWNEPAWSISAEWFAYLVFLGLAPLLLRLRSAISALVAACGILIAATGILWTVHEHLSHSHPLFRVTVEFACGASLCRARQIDKLFLSARTEAPALLLFGLFLIAASTTLNDSLLIGILASMIFFSASSCTSYLLGSRVLVWLGEISYSIFMLHYPVLITFRHLVDRFLPHAPPFMLPMIATALVVAVIGSATIMYKLVEHPARQKFRNALGTLSSQSTLVPTSQSVSARSRWFPIRRGEPDR
jgi:peptidoglycan/LPS O-acetylase OafA/YrhL